MGEGGERQRERREGRRGREGKSEERRRKGEPTRMTAPMMPRMSGMMNWPPAMMATTRYTIHQRNPTIALTKHCASGRQRGKEEGGWGREEERWSYDEKREVMVLEGAKHAGASDD